MADKEELDEVYSKYKSTVNMSASELERWSKNPCSKLASQDRSPINRNLRLLRKNKSEWTQKDIDDANRTISFVSRMKGVSRGEPERVPSEDYPNGCPSARDISLLNWAYDPRKANKKYEDVEKPFAGFEDFGACVSEMRSEGKTKEEASAICGKLQEEYKVDKSANCKCTTCHKGIKNVNLKSNHNLVKEEQVIMNLKETLEKIDGALAAVKKNQGTLELNAEGLVEYVNSEISKAEAEEGDVRESRLSALAEQIALAKASLEDGAETVTVEVYEPVAEEDEVAKRLDALLEKAAGLISKLEETPAEEVKAEVMDHRQSDAVDGPSTGGGFAEQDLNGDNDPLPAKVEDAQKSDEVEEVAEEAAEDASEEAAEEVAEEQVEEEASEDEEVAKSMAICDWPEDLNDPDKLDVWSKPLDVESVDSE